MGRRLGWDGQDLVRDHPQPEPQPGCELERRWRGERVALANGQAGRPRDRLAGLARDRHSPAHPACGWESAPTNAAATAFGGTPGFRRPTPASRRHSRPVGHAGDSTRSTRWAATPGRPTASAASHRASRPPHSRGRPVSGGDGWPVTHAKCGVPPIGSAETGGVRAGFAVGYDHGDRDLAVLFGVADLTLLAGRPWPSLSGSGRWTLLPYGERATTPSRCCGSPWPRGPDSRQITTDLN